jgi:hypothetical protein
MPHSAALKSGRRFAIMQPFAVLSALDAIDGASERS